MLIIFNDIYNYSIKFVFNKRSINYKLQITNENLLYFCNFFLYYGLTMLLR